VHLLRPPCTVPLHALHRAMVLLIGLFTATPLFLCFARSSLKKKKTASRFCLCLICYSSLSFISHCAYCNFPFLTVQLIFPSEQPTTHSHCMFLLTTSSAVTPRIFLGKNAQQLNRQPSKNHDSVLLTES
jgi:hypothetical protein